MRMTFCSFNENPAPREKINYHFISPALASLKDATLPEKTFSQMMAGSFKGGDPSLA
jgi:hypothetical protein